MRSSEFGSSHVAERRESFDRGENGSSSCMDVRNGCMPSFHEEVVHGNMDLGDLGIGSQPLNDDERELVVGPERQHSPHVFNN
ncbi:hypothetical protein Hanom_Chr13g01200331 [Helianthus anomalus]